MKAKRSKAARPDRDDPIYRARQLALLKAEVAADCRALRESLNLILAELKSWK